MGCLFRLALKKKSFFEDFNKDKISKPQSLENEQIESLVKDINFYEITTDRLAIDDYDEFNEDEVQFDFLEGLMKYLNIKHENENNLEELKKFMKDKWKLLKEKKKVYKSEGKIYDFYVFFIIF